MSACGYVRRPLRPAPPRGMTMLELAVTIAIFSVVVIAAYGALHSMQLYTQTNTTQIELQEEARVGMELLLDRLQFAARYTEAGTPPRPYPVLFKSASGIPVASGYNGANSHGPKNPPKAPAGSVANGGDPTADSDEIIFKIPQSQADGTPVLNSGVIVWTTEEYGFFIVPQLDGTNTLEYRNSTASQQQLTKLVPVRGDTIARYVDRIQIQDYGTDPTLTSRQLRVTLYLTRRLDPSNPKACIIVALSSVVDMRNTNQMD